MLNTLLFYIILFQIDVTENTCLTNINKTKLCVTYHGLSRLRKRLLSYIFVFYTSGPNFVFLLTYFCAQRMFAFVCGTKLYQQNQPSSDRYSRCYTLYNSGKGSAYIETDNKDNQIERNTNGIHCSLRFTLFKCSHPLHLSLIHIQMCIRDRPMPMYAPIKYYTTMSSRHQHI